MVVRLEEINIELTFFIVCQNLVFTIGIEVSAEQGLEITERDLHDDGIVVQRRFLKELALHFFRYRPVELDQDISDLHRIAFLDNYVLYSVGSEDAFQSGIDAFRGVVGAAPDECVDRNVPHDTRGAPECTVMVVMHVGKEDIVQFLYSQKLEVLHESCRVAGHSAVDQHGCSVREYYQAGITELGACLLGYGLLLAAHEVVPDCVGLLRYLDGILSPGNSVSNDGVLYELNASAAGFTNDAAVVFTWNVVESTLGVIEYDSEDGYFAFTLEKGGTATITVTGTYAAESESDTETCSVTVTQSKVSVIDIPSSTSVYAGMTVDLEAELTIVGTPTQSQQTVTWVSSNAKATVEASPSDSKQATVTGVSAGEAIITAFVDLNGNGACDVGEINDTCTVTITTIEIYTQITDAKYIYAGMKVVIGCSSQNEVITTAPTSSNKYFATAATAANISAGKLPSSNALEFTITGTVGNWTLTTDGGYVMADDASKDMVLSGGTSTWSITISGGNAVIIDTNENQGWQLMRNNSLSRIKAYVVGGQTAIQLYAKDEADTEQGHIYSFIRNNMRMGDTALAGNGTGACTSSGYYSSAKTAFNGAGLTASERAAFFNEANTQYAAARARLTAWASANGESFNTTENVLKAARTDIGIVANHTNNSQVLIIVLISTLSILSIGVYFFIRKRKEQN